VTDVLAVKLELVTILFQTLTMISSSGLASADRLNSPESRTRFDHALVLCPGCLTFARSDTGRAVCSGHACAELAGCEKVALLTRPTSAVDTREA
jgi:hypothetical protein